MARNPAAKPNPARIADEQHQCLTLRRRGKTVRDIADATGLTKSTVQNRLDAALAEIVHPAAESVRTLELLRLDTYLDRLEEQLDNGEAAERIVPTLLKIGERRARLLGLDAPTQSEVRAQVDTSAEVQALLDRARGVRGAAE